jgi:hypothetical protein
MLKLSRSISKKSIGVRFIHIRSKPFSLEPEQAKKIITESVSFYETFTGCSGIYFKRHLIPFTGGISNVKHKYSAKYGIDHEVVRVRFVYNSSLKMSMPQTYTDIETDWYNAEGTVDGSYDGDNVGIHVLATKNFSSKLMGQEFAIAESDLIEIEKNNSNREIFVDRDIPDSAVRTNIYNKIKETEINKVKSMLLQSNHADRVEIKKFEPVFEPEIKLIEYYVPIYAHHDGRYMKILNMNNNRVYGNKKISPILSSFGLSVPVCGLIALADIGLPLQIAGGAITYGTFLLIAKMYHKMMSAKQKRGSLFRKSSSSLTKTLD